MRVPPRDPATVRAMVASIQRPTTQTGMNTAPACLEAGSSAAQNRPQSAVTKLKGFRSIPSKVASRREILEKRRNDLMEEIGRVDQLMKMSPATVAWPAPPPVQRGIAARVDDAPQSTSRFKAVSPGVMAHRTAPDLSRIRSQARSVPQRRPPLPTWTLRTGSADLPTFNSDAVRAALNMTYDQPPLKGLAHGHVLVLR